MRHVVLAVARFGHEVVLLRLLVRPVRRAGGLASPKCRAVAPSRLRAVARRKARLTTHGKKRARLGSFEQLLHSMRLSSSPNKAPFLRSTLPCRVPRAMSHRLQLVNSDA